MKLYRILAQWRRKRHQNPTCLYCYVIAESEADARAKFMKKLGSKVREADGVEIMESCVFCNEYKDGMDWWIENL